MSFHTAGSPQGGRACAHTRVGTTCGRWVRSGGPGGPRRPVPLVPLWPSSPPHPHSPSGLCPDVGTAQGPLGSLTKAGRMWGRPELEGQEGSLSRDNRWKGRRNWERPGLGWPEPILSPGTSGSGRCASLLLLPSPLCHSSFIVGPSSPPASVIPTPAGFWHLVPGLLT